MVPCTELFQEITIALCITPKLTPYSANHYHFIVKIVYFGYAKAFGCYVHNGINVIKKINIFWILACNMDQLSEIGICRTWLHTIYHLKKCKKSILRTLILANFCFVWGVLTYCNWLSLKVESDLGLQIPKGQENFHLRKVHYISEHPV